MRIILDTGVWTRFLRQKQQDDGIAEATRRCIRKDAVHIIGSVRQELLSGARPSEHFIRLREYLGFYRDLPLNEHDYETAAEYYNLCRDHGVRGQQTDFLICAAAVRFGLKIFTLDGDLESYQSVLPIKLYQV